MRLRTLVFGLLGTVATVLAAALLFAPDLLLSNPAAEALVGAAESTNPRHLLLGGSLLVGLYLTVAARSATRPVREGEGADAFDEATEDPPEAVTTARQRLTAAELDESFEAAVAGDGQSLDTVRDRLRETATVAYAQTTGCSREAAQQAVDQGEWTDDRTAAATLAGDDGPAHSILSRLYLWLDPESERRRRLTRAVDAARGLMEGWR